MSPTRSTRSSSISCDGVFALDGLLTLPVLITLIVVALAFDFLNGLHDAANSIATIVSTRVLRPRYAVMWAAFFNFIAFLFFGLHPVNRSCCVHARARGERGGRRHPPDVGGFLFHEF